MSQDVAKLSAVVNVRDALAKFLTLKDVAFDKATGDDKTFELALAAQPSWLDLPEPYIAAALADVADGSAAARTRALKARIKEDFRYAGKPPKWLQSPDWVFVDDKPTVFLGQLNMNGLLHDRAQLYVFFEERTKEVHHRIQTY